MQNELPEEYRCGFLKLAGVRTLPLRELRGHGLRHADFELGFTLWGKLNAAGGDCGTLYIKMYKLPEGEEALAEDLELQTDKSNDWGRKPRETYLTLAAVPKDWSHEAFPMNPRRVVHVYRNTSRALMIRYTSDHIDGGAPLLDLANQNLRIDPNAWDTEFAAMVVEPGAKPWLEPEPTDEEIPPLDLRVEEKAIEQMILDAVKKFSTLQQTVESELYELPVAGIVMTYDVGNGHVSLNFDVREPYEPDGSYSHEGFGALPRDNWQRFCSAAYDGKRCEVILRDGSTQTAKDEEGPDLDSEIGQMLVDMLKRLRDTGKFSSLRAATQCHLCVESPEGNFAWPAYDDLGKDDLL